MTVLLVANIGNSDVEIKDEFLPPLSVGQGRWSIRRRGEEISNDPAIYAKHIRLPLLGPTLRWLVEQSATDLSSLQLVLFATDQPVELTREDERQKDTLPMAEAAKKLLVQPDSFRQLTGLVHAKTALTNKQVQIRRISGSPADYSNMLAWYSAALPDIQKRYAADQVFLEVSGGTPAMTAMLILAGVEVFGSQARTLYINRGDSQPYEVNVASELYAQQIRRSLRTQIQMHAYSVALETLKEHGQRISGDERLRAILAALLHYADRRLAFDFDEARAALSRARQATTGDTQVHVQYWLRQLESSDIALHLAELLHSTRIKHGFGDYADFAQRLFRFQEASLRYIAATLGMKTKDVDGLFIDLQWVAAQPGLTEHLDGYHLDIPLNRKTLGAVVSYFILQGARPEWAETVDKLQALSQAADLRNKGISGHGFQGISRERLEAAYGASLPSMLDRLEGIYQALFGRGPGDSPYVAVNALIDTLL